MPNDISEQTCWQLEAQDKGSNARAGHLAARDGSLLETPLFQPVATAGSLKTLDWRDLEGMGYRHVLMNTYHLVVRPGLAELERAGGVKGYTGWRGSVLTDSGGYQVHSLSKRRSLREDGVRFRDHLQGDEWNFSPESTLRAQLTMGVDFAMVLDVCTGLPATEKRVRSDMALTHAWASEQAKLWPELVDEYSKPQAGTPALPIESEGGPPCPPPDRRHGGLRHLDNSTCGTPALQNKLFPPRLFGIVQGGLDESLRKESAGHIASLGFDGNAVGGLAVGEERDDFQRVAAFTAALLPHEKPRYLMGLGEPADLLFAIAQGYDMFDCVQPTRMARHGTAYTRQGKLKIKLARFDGDERPLDERCRCPVCRRHSRAYIRHLTLLKEHSYARLLTIHNLYFYRQLMQRVRRLIVKGTYDGWWQKQFALMDRVLPEGL